MTHNFIHSLPSELSQCSKLRTISFDDNPIDNKRLVKILNHFGETKPKAALNYLLPPEEEEEGRERGRRKRAEELHWNPRLM